VTHTDSQEVSPGATPETPRATDHRAPSWFSRVRSAERRRAADRRGAGLVWRLVTPAVFVSAGALLVTSGINAEGTDLRAGRYDDLADLAMLETERVQEVRDEVTSLNSEIESLSESVTSDELTAIQAEIDQLELLAGVTAVAGPGVTVTLDDAPYDVIDSAGELVEEAIVHQQDIQAVANALWAGGAEAMTIQGQRVVSTTGIKCIGNTVRLQDVPYSPPYVISAVGNPETMLASIESNPYVDGYLEDVEQWQLGWDVIEEDRIEAPDYTGPLVMEYARPANQLDDDGT